MNERESLLAARKTVAPAVAYADADYVLRWLRQSAAPENIIELQERVTTALAVGLTGRGNAG